MSTRTRVALVAMVLTAVALRFIRLGALSLAGDEETTTLAAQALLEGWPPRLPGGLVYLRSLPFTLLEAASIWTFGISETSLRLVSALAAGLRVAASFWLARTFVSRPAALAVAGLVAIAPLDLEFSRVGRMYSLFAAVDLVFLVALVRYARLGTGLLATGGWAVLTVATHQLGVLHAPVPAAAAVAPGLPVRRRVGLAGLAVLGLIAYGVYFFLIEQSYAGMGEIAGAPARAATPLPAHVARLLEVAARPAAAALVALGTIATLFLAFSALRSLATPLARASAVAAAAAFALASPVYGAVLALAALVLEREPLIPARPPVLRLGAAGLVGSAAWAAAATLSLGPEAAPRLLLGFPAPNWLEFLLAMPLFFPLALAGVAVAANRSARAESVAPWLILLAAALAPALLGGALRRTEALRFQIHAFVPLLILAFMAVEAAAVRLVGRRALATAVATAVLVLCLRPDQSLEILRRRHGLVASPMATLGVAPDHRSAGRFVREHAAAEDWIAAEDPLQQRFYAGRVDFWLRRFEDAAGFLRRDPDDGSLRDVYVGARQVSDLDELRKLAEGDGHRVVWLVTSGEVEAEPRFYRTPQTDATLRLWRPRARFVAEDGLTRVYRLVDGEPT